MPPPSRRQGVSAVYWLAALLLILGVAAVLTETIVIPGAPTVPAESLQVAKPLLLVLVILLGTKFLLEVFKPLFRAGLANRIPSEADIFAMYQLFTYAAWLATLGFAVYVLIGGNLAEIGVVGGAVILGVLIYVLQEPLLNIVGWVILVSRRVYKLGDRIEVGGTKGYVVSINPMNTTVREFGGWLSGDIFTGRYATIPNKSILSSSVFNYTKDTPFIWGEVKAAITYESDHAKAEQIMLDAGNEVVGEMMRNNRDAVREKYEFRDIAMFVIDEPTVRWRMVDSWVEFILIFFCPAYRKGYYESELTKRILDKIADEPKVSLAYPHMVSVPHSALVPPPRV